jgi:hypothetical protein
MIKDHRVQESRYDDVGVDAQLFLPMTEGETVRQKTTRPFTHEHGQPGYDAVSDEVDRRVVVYAVSLRGNTVMESSSGCTGKGGGNLRSEDWRGRETTPQLVTQYADTEWDQDKTQRLDSEPLGSHVVMFHWCRLVFIRGCLERLKRNH